MTPREIELAIEDGAMESDGWAKAYAILRCAQAIESCARALRDLGNADAATSMGAIEALGKVVRDGLNRIAEEIGSSER